MAAEWALVALFVRQPLADFPPLVATIRASLSTLALGVQHESKDSMWSSRANTDTAEFAAQRQRWQTGVTGRLWLVRTCKRGCQCKDRDKEGPTSSSSSSFNSYSQLYKPIYESVSCLILEHRWCNKCVIVQNELNHTDGASNNQENLGILYQEVMGYFWTQWANLTGLTSYVGDSMTATLCLLDWRNDYSKVVPSKTLIYAI